MNFYKDFDLQLSEDDEEDEAPRGIDQGGDGYNADDSNRSSVSLSPTLYEEGEKGRNTYDIKEEPMEISDDPIEISDDEDTSPVTHSNNNLLESATIPHTVSARSFLLAKLLITVFFFNVFNHFVFLIN